MDDLDGLLCDSMDEFANENGISYKSRPGGQGSNLGFFREPFRVMACARFRKRVWMERATEPLGCKLELAAYGDTYLARPEICPSDPGLWVARMHDYDSGATDQSDGWSIAQSLVTQSAWFFIRSNVAGPYSCDSVSSLAGGLGTSVAIAAAILRAIRGIAAA